MKNDIEYNISGIYKITNIVNNKIYIGSSRNIKNRWFKHTALLRHNKHENKHLQNAWNKYGEENFKFEIVEQCEVEELLIREQFYLDSLLFAQEFISNKDIRFYKLGYNQTPISNGDYNTEESKRKISETLKRKYDSGEIEKQHTKIVFQYNRFNGNLIKVWDCINDANRHYGVTNLRSSKINRCLWGETPSAFDSYWSLEPIEFIYAKKPQTKEGIICVQDVERNTYFFASSYTELAEMIGVPGARSTLKKCHDSNSLYKNRYKFTMIMAPIIYDSKPFELLGRREDLETKTEEEILNGNVKNSKLCDNQQPSS